MGISEFLCGDMQNDYVMLYIYFFFVLVFFAFVLVMMRICYMIMKGEDGLLGKAVVGRLEGEGGRRVFILDLFVGCYVKWLMEGVFVSHGSENKEFNGNGV